MTKKKDSRSHTKADHRTRNITIGASAAIGAVVAAVAAVLYFGGPRKPKGGEHAAPDLAPDAPTPGTNRAPEAFRPDPTAPVPASDREGLRPASGPSPSMFADRGDLAGQNAPAV